MKTQRQIESLLLRKNLTSNNKEELKKQLQALLETEVKASRQKWLAEKKEGFLLEIDGKTYDMSEMIDIEWDDDGTPEGFYDAEEWTLTFMDGSHVSCNPEELPDRTRSILEEYASDTCIWQYGDRGVVIEEEFYDLDRDIVSINWNGRKDEDDIESYEKARLIYLETKYGNVIVVFKEEIEDHWLDNIETSIGLY